MAMIYAQLHIHCNGYVIRTHIVMAMLYAHTLLWLCYMHIHCHGYVIYMHILSVGNSVRSAGLNPSDCFHIQGHRPSLEYIQYNAINLCRPSLFVCYNTRLCPGQMMASNGRTYLTNICRVFIPKKLLRFPASVPRPAASCRVQSMSGDSVLFMIFFKIIK